MPSVASYGVILAVAAIVTLVTTPVAQHFAERWGLVADPDERMAHAEPTARLGGAAMVLGVLVALLTASLMDDFNLIFASGTELLGVALAAVWIFGVGVLDDVREISAPAKIAGMVVAASILSLAGVSLLFFRVPFLELVTLSSDWSALLTVLWVVGMANAINLIDGLDGLAAGIVAIASGTFFLYSLRLGDAEVILPGNPGALIAIITVGVVIGFLPHNVHPAKIFMGDGGALLLGLLMAASTMSVGGRTSAEFSGQAFFFFAPVFIPLVILAVPIVDVVFAILRRAVGGQSVAEADLGHLHHRLVRLGHGHRRSVIIMWLWTALLSGFVLYPTYTGKGDAAVPLGIGALGLLLFTVFHPSGRTRKAVQREVEMVEGEAPETA
ncbi:MAG: MraY family glycosyltransferase [Acidimicrobiales bacterium]